MVGFVFGIIQMIMYVIYKNAGKKLSSNKAKAAAAGAEEAPKLHELSEHIIDVVKLGTMVCTELSPVGVGVLHPNVEVVDAVVEAVIDNIQKKSEKKLEPAAPADIIVKA